MQEVIETINEFAFVASDYPVILSIENHCRKYPHLLQRMATIFKMVFGEKLMGSPLEEFPVRRGGREERGGEREREREREGGRERTRERKRERREKAEIQSITPTLSVRKLQFFFSLPPAR